MRLNSVDRTRILAAAAEQFGPDVAVLLFGSRVDDIKRGGDIDLLVCPGLAETKELLAKKIRFLARLDKTLGERKIDVVIELPGDARPIVRVAHETGVRL
jgi:predicted nucleotidyltransferase